METREQKAKTHINPVLTFFSVGEKVVTNSVSLIWAWGLADTFVDSNHYKIVTSDKHRIGKDGLIS